MLAAGQVQLAGLIRELKGIVSNMQSYFDSMHEESQTVKTAEALKTQGLNLTPEQVRTMKIAGIADPVKAMSIIGPLLKQAMPMARRKKPRTNPKATKRQREPPIRSMITTPT